MGHESTGKEKLQSVWSFRAFISIWQRSQKRYTACREVLPTAGKMLSRGRSSYTKSSTFYHEIGDSTKYKHWSQEQQKIDSIKGYVSERKIDDNIYIKTYKKTHERQ